ncbi:MULTISPECIES: hypothetical protein [Rhizobium]|uniref:hypothetical protein n=1 Tax=Rhizobium TaxID=379 RepID=UPI001FE3450B|nr:MULTISPECIES: hypothetical protein [Rhizobium]
MRSKDFLAAQRDLLRAALDLRTRQQQMTDSAKLFGVPSQRDFDELTRQITELRRELRASGHSAMRPKVQAASPHNQERDEP